MPMRVQGENKQLANVGRISTLPPDAIGLERDVYVASSFRRPFGNHLPMALRTLKRPEGRAPGGSARVRPPMFFSRFCQCRTAVPAAMVGAEVPRLPSSPLSLVSPTFLSALIGVGTRDRTLPLPPNRTGGFPASGSPVSGFVVLRLSASTRVPLSRTAAQSGQTIRSASVGGWLRSLCPRHPAAIAADFSTVASRSHRPP